MKTLVFLTADFANLSSDNKLNIMGVFNILNSVKFPAAHPSMHLIIELGLEPGEDSGPHKMSVYRINESQTEKIQLFENEFHFPPWIAGLMPKHTAIVGIRQMVFPDPGTYEFVLHINDQYHSKTPLHLQQIEISR